MEISLDFRVLGPLEVYAAGKPITVGGPRQRTILAMLLLAVDRVVSVDSLIEAVWNGQPPATGRTQVAICIAALRKNFKSAGCSDDVIITSSPGYMLLSAGHRVDLVEFTQLMVDSEQIAGQGRIADASDLVSDALALWRGPALSGVCGHLVEAEAARIQERRLTAYERRAALKLRLGQHEALIGELTALVQDYPLREQTRGQLMLAEYRSGRRVESLQTFQNGRRHSIEEFGLEPGPALRQLQQAILQDDPALASPTPLSPARDIPVMPLQLPAGAVGFTGRRDELSTMDRMLGHRPDGWPPAFAFVTGGAGVGKTALALHWAHRVADRFPDGQLYADLHGVDDSQQPVAPLVLLGSFLRALGVPADRIPADLSECSALYRSVLEGRRTLIVLDNAESFAQIRPLLPGGRSCCVVVTSRAQLGELVVGATSITLGRLAGDEAVQLLGRLVGDDRISADPGACAEVARLCDGLPLALRISASKLRAKRHWTVRTLADRLVNPQRRLDELSRGELQLRASFALSYRDLPAGAAAMFRRLALLDVSEFAVWAGCALLDIDEVDAEGLLEQLVDAHLLEVAGQDGAQVRYRLTELLRLYARELVRATDSEQERQAAHERVLASWLALNHQEQSPIRAASCVD